VEKDISGSGKMIARLVSAGPFGTLANIMRDIGIKVWKAMEN